MAKAHPEYRVSAYASIYLKEYLRENPYVIDYPRDIEWEVTRSGDYYVATGDIKTTVKIHFLSDETGEHLTEERVSVNGKRVYDARLDEPDIAGAEAEAESGDSVESEENRIRSEMFARYRRNISS